MLLLSFLTLVSNACAVTISSKATLSISRPTVRYLNSTTSPSLTISSGGVCCHIVPNSVLVGQWYNTTFSTTIATVITHFTQYNDTIVTGSTTYNASSALSTIDASLASISFKFIPNGEVLRIFGIPLAYGGIAPILGTETYVDGAGGIKSPANYVGIDTAIIITKTRDGRGCGYQPQDSGTTYYSLGLYYVLPASEVYTWAGRQFQNLGPEFQSFRPTIVSRLLELGADPELMKTCSMVTGEGVPSLHVPMVALTEHISQTITSLGRFNTALNPSPETAATSAAPLPRPTPLPAQTSAAQTGQPRPQPSAPQPPSAPSQPVPASSAPQQISSQAPPVPSQHQSVPSQDQSVPLQGESAPSRPQPVPASSEIQPELSQGQLAPSQGQLAPSQGQLAPSQGQLAPSQGQLAPSQGQLAPSQGQLAPSQSQQQSSASQLEVSQTQVSQSQVSTQPPAGTPTPAPVIVLGSNTIAVSIQTSSPALVLPGDVTLRPGDVVTFSSQILSLQSTGSALVVIGGSSTTTIALVAATPTYNLPATVVTIASTVVPIQYVAGTAGGVILSNGDTLLPGSATEVNGVTVSLAPSATELIVGSSTIELTGGAAASTSQAGAGDFIWSGIGGGPASTSTPAQFTGGGSSFPQYVPVVLAAIACALPLALV